MSKLRRRFRRPLPLMFALTAALAALGGAIYSPNNYDHLTYRFPRMLHWWSQSGWHWIGTPVPAMNRSGADFEWLMMPSLVLLQSDRLFFLINISAFLLMPGLLFTTFVAAGVSKRVAWSWMWLLPLGFCFVMEAGSVGNDLMPVIFVLAAIDFSFQARLTASVVDLRFASLAAGLATGVKAANLPLLLPIACAAWPAWRLVRRGVVLNALTILLTLLVSFLPMALLNQHFAGHWAGDPHNLEQMTVQRPLSGIIGNTLQLTEQTLLPPIFPNAHSVSTRLWNLFPEHFRAALQRDFPKLSWRMNELPQEESAGVGLGLAIMAAAAIAVALLPSRRRPASPKPPAGWSGLAIGAAAWIALLVYMMKIGAEATGRLVAAYYPLLLLPVLLHPAQRALVRRGWWRSLALLAGLAALMALAETPSRPLWPAQSLLEAAGRKFPQSQQLARARTVYSVYGHRGDLFAGIRAHLPASASVVGFIGDCDDPESSLWRPYGARRIVDLTGQERFQPPTLSWVVVKNSILGSQPDAFDRWLNQTGGSLDDQEEVIELVNAGPEKWSLVHFPHPSTPPAKTFR